MDATPHIAAAYIRVSTDDQTEFSPDAQRRALERYAHDHGLFLDPAHIYVDAGLSGRSAAKRPAFQQMVADAKLKPRPFDIILVHKFDRFARSREDSIIYKSLLKKRCGIRVVSITESIEDEKMSVLIEAILEATAEFYSINLGEEVKKGMTEKALRGERQCAPMFGYALEGGKLVPHSVEAPLVQEIYRRFLAGEAYLAIAQWLNALGVKTKAGNAFENRTVEYILRNPAYVGKLRWNPDGRTRRNYDAEGLIIADAQHEPLITQELWDAVQQRVAELKLRHPYHARPASEHKDWISGLMRCSTCGKSMVHNGLDYLACSGYVRGQCATSQRVRWPRARDMIISALLHDAEQDKPLRYIALHPDGGRPSTVADKERSLHSLLLATDTRLARARDAYLGGIDTLEEYTAAKQTLMQQRAQIEEDLTALTATLDDRKVWRELRQRIACLAAALQDPTETKEAQYTAARRLIHSITFDRATGAISIAYYYAQRG